MEQITFHHLTYRPISYFHIRSENTKDKRQKTTYKRQIPVTICKEEGAPWYHWWHSTSCINLKS